MIDVVTERCYTYDMKLTNSLEWPSVERALTQQIQQIKKFTYKQQSLKLLKNVGLLVADLSRLEVEARRTHSFGRQIAEKQLEINEAIGYVEQWVLIAMLS